MTRDPESNQSQPKEKFPQSARARAWCGCGTAGGLCPCWSNLETTTNILSGLSLSLFLSPGYHGSWPEWCQQYLSSQGLFSKSLHPVWLRVRGYITRLPLTAHKSGHSRGYLIPSVWRLALAGRLVTAWRHREWETTTSLVRDIKGGSGQAQSCILRLQLINLINFMLMILMWLWLWLWYFLWKDTALLS